METENPGAAEPASTRRKRVGLGLTVTAIAGLALAVTGTALLGAKASKPAGASGKPAPPLQRLTAKALAATDLGTNMTDRRISGGTERQRAGSTGVACSRTQRMN